MTLAPKQFRLAAVAVAILALLLGTVWYMTANGAEPKSDADDAVEAAGFDTKERAAIEALVRSYILEHPEILPEAIERLREKESLAAMDAIREDLFTPYPGAVLGNPRGETVLVEFSDYACGYCRRSVEAVEKLIAEDPDLKVVIREFPILSDDSVTAAKWALAAAHQGKYEAFHHAMYAAGRPTLANIEKAAKAAGLDVEMARKAAASPAIAAEISANRAFANQLQFGGTPAWVTASGTLEGAVGEDALRKALNEPGSAQGG